MCPSIDRGSSATARAPLCPGSPARNILSRLCPGSPARNILSRLPFARLELRLEGDGVHTWTRVWTNVVPMGLRLRPHFPNFFDVRAQGRLTAEGLPLKRAREGEHSHSSWSRPLDRNAVKPNLGDPPAAATQCGRRSCWRFRPASGSKNAHRCATLGTPFRACFPSFWNGRPMPGTRTTRWIATPSPASNRPKRENVNILHSRRSISG